MNDKIIAWWKKAVKCRKVLLSELGIQEDLFPE
jgi:hypothetical protein